MAGLAVSSHWFTLVYKKGRRHTLLSRPRVESCLVPLSCLPPDFAWRSVPECTENLLPPSDGAST